MRGKFKKPFVKKTITLLLGEGINPETSLHWNVAVHGSGRVLTLGRKVMQHESNELMDKRQMEEFLEKSLVKQNLKLKKGLEA
jgi:hypothetical protein